MDDVFEQNKAERSETLDLNGGTGDDEFLKIEISDALNEKDKVKFTIKTKVTQFALCQ